MKKIREITARAGEWHVVRTWLYLKPQGKGNGEPEA